jgi:hypothetical protein
MSRREGESIQKRLREKAKRAARDAARTPPRARVVFKHGRWVEVDDQEPAR